MTTLILYTTSGCHLCEQAEELLTPVLAYYGEQFGQPLILEPQEISESSNLLERYGLRIPVIQIAGRQNDLGWPFDQAQAFAFLQSELN
jgi:glutaredoxin